MKRFFIAATLAAAAISSAPAFAQISVNIGQPGFYGRLDIGGFAPPPLLFPQPMMIQPVPASRPPLYLHVPEGHARDWRKHCHRYNACGERVFFVQDNWYQREYAPRYQERHSHHEDNGYRDNYRHEERHDHRDEYRGDDRGHGRSEEHGHDHGRGHDRD